MRVEAYLSARDLHVTLYLTVITVTEATEWGGREGGGRGVPFRAQGEMMLSLSICQQRGREKSK